MFYGVVGRVSQACGLRFPICKMETISTLALGCCQYQRVQHRKSAFSQCQASNISVNNSCLSFPVRTCIVLRQIVKPNKTHCWWERKTLDNSLAVPQNVKIELPYDPASPLLGIYQRNWKQVLKQPLVQNVHSSTIHNSRKVETVQVSINGWLDEQMWSIHTMQHYSAMKSNEVLIHARTLVNFENKSERGWT